jgi:putative addiction module antidote
MRVKLRKVGHSAGLILSREVLDRLRLSIGDELILTEKPDSIELHRHDEDFERDVEQAREFMTKHRRAFAALAKR